MHTSRILASLAALGLIGPAVGANWTVDEESSAVTFSAEQQGGKFDGKFEQFSAAIDFDPALPVHGSITGTVVTESVNTRDYDRDGSLMERDWFHVDEYPEATFVSESVEANGDGTFVAHGNLTIKGTTNPAAMQFTFEETDAGATFTGTFKVDRFDFKVGAGYQDTYLVGKDVEVEVSLNLTR